MDNKQKEGTLGLYMSNANGADKKRKYKIQKTELNE